MEQGDREQLLLVSHGYEAIYERGFCNGIADAGAQATLISSDRTDRAGLRPAIRCVNLRGSQAEDRTRWSKAFNLVRYHARLLRYVALRRPVVHVFGLLHPAWLCGVAEGFLFRLLSRRYVVTAHDLLPHDRHTPTNRWLFGLSYRLAHRVVVHTPRMRDDLVRMHRVDPARVVIMEHGLEPWSGSWPRSPLPAAPLRLLFFGKVMRYKGVDLLLKALERVDLPFQLTIAGGCWDADLQQELLRQIEQHPHASSIQWRREYIPEADIPGLFLNADVTLLPYRHIDQSGILFQSLRFGVPLIASRVGSFERYVTGDIGVTFDTGDAAALQRAIEDFAQRRGEFARERVHAAGRRYEWSQTAGVLMPVYACTDGGAR